MAASWKGTIQVKGFEIPVRLYNAVSADEVGLKLCCEEHGSKVNQFYECEKGNEKLTRSELGSAYSFGAALIPISADEKASLIGKADGVIEVLEVRSMAEFPWSMVSGAYHVMTDEKADPLYNAFCYALMSRQWVAIAKIRMRNHDHLVAFAPNGTGRFQVLTLHWPKEMIEFEQNPQTVTDAAAVTVFQTALMPLHKGVLEAVAPGVEDAYTARLTALIQQKVKNMVVSRAAPARQTRRAVSVKRAGQGRAREV